MYGRMKSGRRWHFGTKSIQSWLSNKIKSGKNVNPEPHSWCDHKEEAAPLRTCFRNRQIYNSEHTPAALKDDRF